MKRIVWNDDFSLGNGVFDSQHRQLIDLINETTESLENNAPEADAIPLLRSLQEYARYHFEAEEAYMAEVGFPGLDEHVRQHRYFFDRVQELDARLFSDEVGILNELSEFLGFWLIDHIVISDFKYASFAGTRTDSALMT
jgi:hemerythrin-like metal-binding protein